MASLPSFQQTSTLVTLYTTWEAIINGLIANCNEITIRLIAADQEHGVHESASALQQCNQDINRIYSLASTEELNNIFMHVPFEGDVLGMSGDGVLQFVQYYVNLLLVLAHQKLEMWDEVIANVSWALQIAADNGHNFPVPWDYILFLRMIREDPRLPITRWGAA